MTTPAEFKAIKELRQIDDQGISPDLLMLFESETESLKVLLSQLASYIRKPVEGELIPPGVPQYWPGDTPPNGFVFINNGLTFNTVRYPKLAIAWPTGVIPPHKGLVIECTADGAVTGDTDIGEVKLHKHNASSSQVDLDEYFDTGENGEHNHNYNFVPSEIGDSGGGSGDDANGNEIQESTSSNGNHAHRVRVDFGEHKHEISVDNFGSSRNTVDRINYNVMVRLA